jgi:hypothetical protein
MEAYRTEADLSGMLGISIETVTTCNHTIHLSTVSACSMSAGEPLDKKTVTGISNHGSRRVAERNCGNASKAGKPSARGRPRIFAIQLAVGFGILRRVVDTVQVVTNCSKVSLSYTNEHSISSPLRADHAKPNPSPPSLIASNNC